jgi:hypothetical protein
MESKAKRYAALVSGMDKVVETWIGQMKEPDRTGTFDGWLQCENHGKYIQMDIDRIISLASEVDPESVQKWKRIRDNISNLRIESYQLAKAIDGPERPLPTTEEQATADAEEREARRTGGLSLLKEASRGQG